MKKSVFYLAIYISIFLFFILLGSIVLHSRGSIINSEKEFSIVVANDPISGSRIKFTLQNNTEETYERGEIYYKDDFSQDFRIKELAKQEKTYEVKVDTYEGATNLEYYLIFYNGENTSKFPANSSKNLALNQSGTVNEKVNFSHIPTSFEDVVEQIDMDLTVDDNFPTKGVNIVYKIDAGELKIKNLVYDDTYSTKLHIAENFSEISYYFEIEQGDRKVRFPGDYNFGIRDNSSLNYDTDVENDLIKAINEYAVSSNEKVYMTFDDLGSEYIEIRGGEQVGTLSVIKLWVMIETYRQLDAGIISKTDFVSRYGYSGTVSSALNSMMHYSNNEATGSLIAKVGITNINNTIKEYLGVDAVTTIDHTPGYSDGGLYGGFNVTTTNEQVEILKKLYRGEVVSAEKSEEMINLMKGCSDYFGVKNISGINEIAMKTGYYPGRVYGLSGIVYSDYGDYAFSVFTGDWNGLASKHGVMSDILSIIQEYFEGSGKVLGE
jgi:hypothetical protein